MAGSKTVLLNTVTLSEFTDLIEKGFITFQEMAVLNAEQLFIHQNMADHTGEQRRWDEVDTETYGKLKPQGANAKKAKVGVGYNKTMTVKRIAMEIDITWEHRKFNKKPEVTALLTSLNHFSEQRSNLDLTHRFTFCTSASYVDMDGETVDVTTGDGYALAYSAHTLAHSATTYRNRVSGDPIFSRGALEAAETLAATNILSNFGEDRVMMFNTIVIGKDPNTKNNVKQFLNSTSDVDQNNSSVINVYQGAYEMLVLPNLATTATGAYDSTKRRWWFLVATGQGMNGWQAHYGVWEPNNMKSPMPGNNGEDFHNDNWTYGCRKAYGIAVVVARGFIASCPTS